MKKKIKQAVKSQDKIGLNYWFSGLYDQSIGYPHTLEELPGGRTMWLLPYFKTAGIYNLLYISGIYLRFSIKYSASKHKSENIKPVFISQSLCF